MMNQNLTSTITLEDFEKSIIALKPASNAALALSFGLDIPDLITQEDQIQACEAPEYGRRSQKTAMRQNAILALAWSEAVRVFAGSATKEMIEQDDLAAIEALRDYPMPGAEHLFDRAYDRYVTKLRSETRRLVKKLRPQIEALKTAFLERENLTAEQVQQIYQSA